MSAQNAPAPAAPSSAQQPSTQNEQQPSGSAAQPRPARVALWDNARLILILLVVIGHTITTIRTNDQLGFGLYAWIYAFHMPAMIFLGGIFMKPDMNAKAVRSIVQLLVTWLLLEVAWVFIRMLLGQGAVHANALIVPSWTLWFLVTLATMRILLPIIARFRWPITLSIVLALGAGFSSALGTEFSAMRTLAFLPFFVIAWAGKERGWYKRDTFLNPKAPQKIVAWVIFAGLLLGATLFSGFKDFWRVDKWLTWRDPYLMKMAEAPVAGLEGVMHADPVGITANLTGLALSALLMLIAGALTWSLLVIAPRGEHWFTVWGSRTLYVYLLHGPIIQALREFKIINAVYDWGVIGFAVLIAGAIVLTAILSTKIVTKIFRPVIEPKFDWMLQK